MMKESINGMSGLLNAFHFSRQYSINEGRRAANNVTSHSRGVAIQSMKYGEGILFNEEEERYVDALNGEEMPGDREMKRKKKIQSRHMQRLARNHRCKCA